MVFEKHPVFGMEIPTTCPGVPNDILNPRNTWTDKAEYDAKAKSLAKEFVQNFEKYTDQASAEIVSAGPKG